MKVYIKLFLILFIVFECQSCTDFLDRDPHELVLETYFNNDSELESFLTTVYSPIMAYQFYGGYYPLYNAGGDDLTFFGKTYEVLCVMNANVNSSNDYLTAYWRTLYEGVNRSNILLENVNNNQKINEDLRKRIEAEALFLRSFYYFNLVQGWGDVPFRLKSTKSAYGHDIPRMDKQIIYDRIISDIEQSIPYLIKADEINYTGRVTQSVAKAFLARVYLFRAGEYYRDKKPFDGKEKEYYANARRWALEVKNSGLHGLVSSYQRVFLDLCEDKYNSTGIRESIWEAEFAGNIASADRSYGYIGVWVGLGANYDYNSYTALRQLSGVANPGYGYRFAIASLKMFSMYEAEGDTARGNWNIANYEYTYAGVNENFRVKGRNYYYGKRPEGLTSINGFPCLEQTQSASNSNKTRIVGKYRREHELLIPKDKNASPINYPIIRYSDVLLMLAEAENELNGPTELAYECLNSVRERAKIVPLNGLTKDEFRNAIKDERAMELCYESLRRWDLIRWGDFTLTMNQMTNFVQSPGWSIGYKYADKFYRNITDAYNYYPIPDLETANNKMITENNPGW
ncbi:MAG: RagB/SusD family nutrient uptake outer membrane protein [Fermentimonas sp.]|jgi:hypothetical protein